MKTNWIFGLMVPGLLLASTATTQANDIVDFLNAINGRSHHRTAPPIVQPVGHRHHGGPAMSGRGDYGHDFAGQGYAGQALSSRDLHKLHTANRNAGYSGHGYSGHGYSGRGDARFDGSRFDDDRVSFRDRDFRKTDYGRSSSIRPSGAQINFRVSSNSGMAQGYGGPVYNPASPRIHPLPPVQVLPPVHSYPQAYRLPHQIGEIVDCQVPLANNVRVRNVRKIAPNAVPIVVAIRDPSMCAHDRLERVVYVQVFAPPCPPRSITISPCGTRVSLCFGRYDVDIKSLNDLIVVDYDN